MALLARQHARARAEHASLHGPMGGSSFLGRGPVIWGRGNVAPSRSMPSPLKPGCTEVKGHRLPLSTLLCLCWLPPSHSDSCMIISPCSKLIDCEWEARGGARQVVPRVQHASPAQCPCFDRSQRQRLQPPKKGGGGERRREGKKKESLLPCLPTAEAALESDLRRRTQQLPTPLAGASEHPPHSWRHEDFRQARVPPGKELGLEGHLAEGESVRELWRS